MEYFTFQLSYFLHLQYETIVRTGTPREHCFPFDVWETKPKKIPQDCSVLFHNNSFGQTCHLTITKGLYSFDQYICPLDFVYRWLLARRLILPTWDEQIAGEMVIFRII
jgi:hypothetical protein